MMQTRVDLGQKRPYSRLQEIKTKLTVNAVLKKNHVGDFKTNLHQILFGCLIFYKLDNKNFAKISAEKSSKEEEKLLKLFRGFFSLTNSTT